MPSWLFFLCGCYDVVARCWACFWIGFGWFWLVLGFLLIASFCVSGLIVGLGWLSGFGWFSDLVILAFGLGLVLVLCDGGFGVFF